MDIQKVTPDLVLKGLLLKQYKLGYHGVNLVYSGFNEYLRKHCSLDPATYTKPLVDNGIARIAGRKIINKFTNRESSSVLLMLTEKGEKEWGIHPPTAGSAVTPSSDKKVNKLVEDTAKMF